MCPGHVPGSRSDTVSERSTTLATNAKSKAPPSKPLEIPFGIEADLFRIPDYLGFGVPERLLADVADDQVFDGGLLRLLDAEDAEASDHVRVHPCPRVVLSQRIDVEHVYLRDREIRHHPHVVGEELGLALVDLLRGYRLDYGRLVVGV